MFVNFEISKITFSAVVNTNIARVAITVSIILMWSHLKKLLEKWFIVDPLFISVPRTIAPKLHHHHHRCLHHCLHLDYHNHHIQCTNPNILKSMEFLTWSFFQQNISIFIGIIIILKRSLVLISGPWRFCHGHCCVLCCFVACIWNYIFISITFMDIINININNKTIDSILFLFVSLPAGANVVVGS